MFRHLVMFLIIAIIIFLVFVVFVVFSRRATGKTNDVWSLLRKSDLRENTKATKAYESLVDFYHTSKRGFFEGKNQKKLAYAIFSGANKDKAIVLVNGRAENSLKQAELILALSGLGFTIYSYDHRGQGFSDRLIASSAGYVESFEYYVDDLKTFYDSFVTPAKHREIFVIGHSMGGAIAALFMERNPQAFAKAVLLTPMIKIKTGVYPYLVGRWLAWLNIKLGHGEEFVPGGSKFNLDSKFEGSEVTHSSVRYYYDNYINRRFPKLQVGSASYHWVGEAMKTTEVILDNASKLKTDTLIIQAELDTYVDNEAQAELCLKAPKCKIEKIDGSLHETYNEVDGIRTMVFEKIVKFLF